VTGGGRKMRAQAWFGGTGKNSMMHRSWMKNGGMPSDVFDGRPVIGICNAWSELTRCNAQRDRAARPRRRTDQGPRQQCRPRDHHRVENLTVEYRNDHQEVNLRHQFFASQAVRRQMRDSGGGAIVNLGSINWMDGEADCIIYVTAKAAVNGLTRGLAREFGPENICVNCVVTAATARGRRQPHVHLAELHRGCGMGVSGRRYGRGGKAEIVSM
jgi:NAD(P)-dependent dehydrogenase (short-subunit alcohol dehydrogenase family)